MSSRRKDATHRERRGSVEELNGAKKIQGREENRKGVKRREDKTIGKVKKEQEGERRGEKRRIERKEKKRECMHQVQNFPNRYK